MGTVNEDPASTTETLETAAVPTETLVKIVDMPEMSNNANSNSNSTTSSSPLPPSASASWLLQWELDSLVGIQSGNNTRQEAIETCTPPRGVSDNCCIGTNTRERWSCRSKRREDYEDRVAAIAQRYTLPLPTNSNNHNHPLTNTTASSATPIPIPEACDICRMAELMLQHGLHVVFVGDSVSRQSVQALACALQREQEQHGYTVGETEVLPHDAKSFRFDLFAPDMGNDHKNDNNNNNNKTSRSLSGSVTFHNHYKVPPPSVWEDMILPGADVLVVNFGVHWLRGARRNVQQPSRLISGWEGTLRHWMSTNTTSFPRLLAVRETTAQHFRGEDGEYYLRNPNIQECVSLQGRRSNLFGWRDKLATELAAQHGMPIVRLDELGVRPSGQESITDESNEQQEHQQRQDQKYDDNKREMVILPFREYTAELHFLHPFDGIDCTHFCYTPLMWTPLWRSLRIAMDSKFGTE